MLKTYFDAAREQGSKNVDAVEDLLKYCVETEDLIIFTGPHGSGKLTLMENLLNTLPDTIPKVMFPERGGELGARRQNEPPSLLWGTDMDSSDAIQQYLRFVREGNRAMLRQYTQNPHGLWHDLLEALMKTDGRGAVDAARNLLQLRIVNVRLGAYKDTFFIDYVVRFIKLRECVYNLQLLAAYDIRSTTYQVG
jgi:energy-coupling factor transporter ATP-binding protein EcfA2